MRVLCVVHQNSLTLVSTPPPPPMTLGLRAPCPLPSGKVSLASHEDNDNDRIDTELQAEPVTYTVLDDHERVAQSHVPFDPNLACLTCKRQFCYGEILRF